MPSQLEQPHVQQCGGNIITLTYSVPAETSSEQLELELEGHSLHLQCMNASYQTQIGEYIGPEQVMKLRSV